MQFCYCQLKRSIAGPGVAELGFSKRERSAGKGMVDTRYGERLGVIGSDQFQQALDVFSLGNFRTARAADSGLFGQCVFVESSKGKFVLRGCPHYDGQLEKERFFAQLIRQRMTVPGPWPYLISHDRSIFGWDFAFMPCLPGQEIGAGDRFRQFSSADKMGIAIAVAETLSELHEVKFDFDGEYSFEQDEIVPVDKPLGDRILADLLSLADDAIAASESTSANDRAMIKAFYAKRSSALELPHRSTYVHHDIKPNNMVAVKQNDTWTITGLFDLMEGYIGDGEEDLPRFAADLMLESEEHLSAFLDTYRRLRPPSAGFEARYDLYLLRDRLTIWSYGQKNGIWYPEGLLFSDWIRQYIPDF